MMEVKILAPDLGNSYTDFVYPGNLQMESIPSLIAPGRAIKYNYNFSDKQVNETVLNNLVLETTDGTYFVGHMAYTKAGASKVKLSHDTEQSLNIKEKLLKVSMGLSLPEVCLVKLVLGHPYSEASVADKLTGMAMGEHSYKLNDKECFHEVVEVETIAQPVAAFRGIVTDLQGKPLPKYAHLFNVPVVVTDIGGGTCDICWIEKNPVSNVLEVVDHLSGSTRLGIWYALELIKEEILMKYSINKSLVELEYELKGNRTTVNLDGKLVDIKEIKRTMYNQTASDIMTYATNLWPGEQKKRIGHFFSTGGGTETLLEVLTPRYNALFPQKYDLIDKFAIARGQWSKAFKNWGGQ